MIDPFTYWSRMMAAGVSIAETGMRLGETLGASNEVIGTRSDMIGRAMHSRSDHAELARMVPEKLEAFAKSGTAAFDIWSTMGAAWLRETQHLTTMAMRGRLPTATELTALAGRTAAYSIGAVEAGAALGEKALAPVHRAATGNARRLRRGAAKRTARG